MKIYIIAMSDNGGCWIPGSEFFSIFAMQKKL